MTYIFAKTETTGLIRWGEPSDSASQPRVIRVCWKIGIDGPMRDGLIKCPISIRPEITKINGITDSIIAQYGVEAEAACYDLYRDIEDNDPTHLVCPGVKFHKRALRIFAKQGGLGMLADRIEALEPVDPVVIGKGLLDPDGVLFGTISFEEVCSRLFGERLQRADTTAFVRLSAEIIRRKEAAS